MKNKRSFLTGGVYARKDAGFEAQFLGGIGPELELRERRRRERFFIFKLNDELIVGNELISAGVERGGERGLSRARSAYERDDLTP